MNNTKKILIADDVREVRMILKEMLLHDGFECTMTENGEEAIILIENSEFDVVLADIEMPVVDGFELIFMIKNNINERIKKIPVIAITAYHSYSLVQRCLRAGFSAVLAKPHSQEELTSAVRKVLK